MRNTNFPDSSVSPGTVNVVTHRLGRMGGQERSTMEVLMRLAEKNWKVKPKIYAGDEFHENIILVFGKKPRTAIFAHLDSIGFTVRYGKQLVKVGGPVLENGINLVGSDSKGEIECKLAPCVQKFDNSGAFITETKAKSRTRVIVL